MVTSADCKYILSEIRNIPYYEYRIGLLNAELHEIDMQIAGVTEPVSPNGGKDVVINGKKIRIKVVGSHDSDSGSRISELITKQQPIEQELREFKRRAEKANSYRLQIIEHDDSQFVIEFLAGVPYRELQKKHFVTNAYERMLRIISHAIKKL